MATGDSSSFVTRIKSLIPYGWFSNVAAPNANAVIGGISDALAWGYSLYAYAQKQTRLATASDFWLDLAAFDFLGLTLRRSPGQTDASFRTRLVKAILQPRVTRAGMVSAVTNLTGRAPVIFEPWSCQDAGGWDTGFCGWDTSGGWGELDLPAQVFIIAYRTGVRGVPNVSGLDGDGTGAWASGGWDAGSIEWIDDTLIGGAVMDSDIYAEINHTRPTGSIAWVNLQ